MSITEYPEPYVLVRARKEERWYRAMYTGFNWLLTDDTKSDLFRAVDSVEEWTYWPHDWGK